MTPVDPVEAGQTAKQAAALLRDARTMQRRFDKLATSAAGAEPVTLRYLAEVREALERLVAHLAGEERGQHRRAAQAERRRR
jgi:hypothetical protein